MADQDLSSLVHARYGAEQAWPSQLPARLPVNSVLETILTHRSIRTFLPSAPLPEGTLSVLVAAAQSAPTSSNLQTWSIVALAAATATKDRAATLSGNQQFIRDAPLFLVFCADLQRLTAVSAQRGTRGDGLAYTEMFLMASVDAALAAQNAVVAAEGLGLGTCYVGGVRNAPREMAALLGLPDRVIAVFGLAVGVPDPEKAVASAVKPRLAMDEVLHCERWGGGHEEKEEQQQQEEGEQKEGYQEMRFRQYDDVLASFNAGQKREDAPTWTERSAKRVEGVANLTGRHVWSEVLRERGFGMK